MNARSPIPTITLILLNAALIGASVPLLVLVGYSWRAACLEAGVVTIVGVGLVLLHLKFVRRDNGGSK